MDQEPLKLASPQLCDAFSLCIQTGIFQTQTTLTKETTLAVIYEILFCSFLWRNREALFSYAHNLFHIIFHSPTTAVNIFFRFKCFPLSSR